MASNDVNAVIGKSKIGMEKTYNDIFPFFFIISEYMPKTDITAMVINVKDTVSISGQCWRIEIIKPHVGKTIRSNMAANPFLFTEMKNATRENTVTIEKRIMEE